VNVGFREGRVATARHGTRSARDDLGATMSGQDVGGL
jgi:hypothetical protein